MVASNASESRRTTVEKASDREVVVTRTFDAPARLVFKAWSDPALFRQWWVPRSMGMTLRSCEMDVRTGGTYRLVFGEDPANTMAFFGRYLEVVPDERIVWTNEEGGEAASVSTVTLEERDGRTHLVMRARYPSKEALEAAGTGAQEAMAETFAQLDELLGALGAR
ncbi:MAG TPA: SRPBCC family protein [Usitatibacter sp.]|nr:SRPBCC family protein [Usitatibacter sp.]